MDAMREWFQSAANPFDIALTQLGIEVVDKRGRVFFYRWELFDSFYEGRYMTMLFDSASLRYYPIPTHALTDSTIRELSQFLSCRLTRSPVFRGDKPRQIHSPQLPSSSSDS